MCINVAKKQQHRVKESGAAAAPERGRRTPSGWSPSKAELEVVGNCAALLEF
jgi:hypothetical protein